MAEMKTLNGYEVVDAKARADIEELKTSVTDLPVFYIDLTHIAVDDSLVEEGSVFESLITYLQSTANPNAVVYMRVSYVDEAFYPVRIINTTFPVYTNSITLQYDALNLQNVANNTALTTFNVFISWSNNKWYYKVVENTIKEPTIATKEYVDNALDGVSGGSTVDLSNYYTKDETYTKTEVDNAISNIDIPEYEPTDLTNYYTKTETYSKTEVDNLFANIAIAEEGSY